MPAWIGNPRWACPRQRCSRQTSQRSGPLQRQRYVPGAKRNPHWILRRNAQNGTMLLRWFGARWASYAILLYLKRIPRKPCTSYSTHTRRHWDDIQATLHMCLTFERMSDPILIPAIRVMAQCLTNWITGHDEAKTMLWTACVVPPASTSSLQVIQYVYW